MMIFWVFACLIIGGSVTGANADRWKRVVGGDLIDISAAPYQVSIRYDDFHICGGALISRNHVLTAAHCVYKLFVEPYDDLTVVTGSDNLKKGGTTHYVRSIKWHDDYVHDKYFDYDVAVITLTEDVEENENQKPIALPVKDVVCNATGSVTGFGRTVTENPYLSDILRRVNVSILPSEACKRFADNNKILDNQICGLQRKGFGTCKGDSGGPLVHCNTVVGIASWYMDPCGSGVPDVYTNVYRYLAFIKKAMNKGGFFSNIFTNRI